MMANAADQYTLHQETPTTGSNIPAVTAIGDIDFNKRYADLTPNEVASVKISMKSWEIKMSRLIP